MIFYKTYHKIFLAPSKIKKWIILLYSLLRGETSLKNQHHFKEHIHVQIWFGEIITYNDKKTEQISSE